MHRSVLGGLLLVVVIVLSCSAAPVPPADGSSPWGTIKGRVVWGEKTIPAPRLFDEDNHRLDDNLRIHPKSRGVQDVLVYLADPANPANDTYSPKVHPLLKKPARASVTVEYTAAAFVPRVAILREGQSLTVKNVGRDPGDFRLAYYAGVKGPDVNRLIKPQDQLVIGAGKEKFQAGHFPALAGSSINYWLRGSVAVFRHPYAAVTDADGNFVLKRVPAGKFRVVLWHPRAGWVVRAANNPKERGIVGNLPAGGKVIDLGKIGFKVPDQ